MNPLDIKKYPDPVLRKKAEEVQNFYPALEKLAKDMAETMQEADGVGLAANQAGILKKIIVVRTDSGVSAFINPKILKKSGKKTIEEEGCLSLPGVFLKIKRHEEILVEAQNEKGEKLRLNAKGMLARIFQHEIDHLQGRLIIDRIPFWKKWRVKKLLTIN